MCGLAQGRDGLAQVNADGILEIVIPIGKDEEVRVELWPLFTNFSRDSRRLRRR
jgi:hypothetical protein